MLKAVEESGSITISDPSSEFAAKYPNGLTLDDLLPFYQDVAQNKPIILEWKFPGRAKRPSPQDQEGRKEEATASGEQDKSTNDSQQQQLDFAEFDFDTETSAASAASTAASASVQRPLGSSARPVRERRVARLDKILREDQALRRLEEQMRQQTLRKPQQQQEEEQPDQEGQQQTETEASQTQQHRSEPEVMETENAVGGGTEGNSSELATEGEAVAIAAAPGGGESSAEGKTAEDRPEATMEVSAS